MKTKDSGQDILTKLLEEEQEHVKKSGDLYGILSMMDLSDAPQAVRESGKTIVDWLEEEGYTVENAVHKPGEDEEDDEEDEDEMRRRGKKDEDKAIHGRGKKDEEHKAKDAHEDEEEDKFPFGRPSRRKKLVDALLRAISNNLPNTSKSDEEDPAEKALEDSLPDFLKEVKDVITSETGDKKEGMNKAVEHLETAVSEKIAA